MYKLLKNHLDQQLIPKHDLSMPDNRDHWKRGATFDPELGLVYKNPAEKGSFLFLCADQLRRVSSAMLKKYIKAVQKSNSSDPKAKKEILLRMQWLLEIRKFWGYAARQGVMDQR
ncbi:hypothetical protein L1887_28171 [Cichorium endivia]|nr:hypothetical protein L1887_28171 [Cichorium endivia]